VIRWAMDKLGVEEWLVSAVVSMYTGAKTVVRTVNGNSNCFEVKVGMHKGSPLSPLLFVTVIEALSREFRVALPWVLYVEDSVVAAVTEDNLIKRLDEWKDNVKNRGVRGKRQNVMQKTVRWPCCVCVRGIGNNSIQCTSYEKWVHRKCSSIKGSMYKVMKSFVYRGCMNPVIGTGRTSVDIGVNANLVLVDKLCFLLYMLSIYGDADAAV